MKLFNIFTKNYTKQKPSKFSEFFLHAPEERKKEVFNEAAKKANEEQREIFTKAHLKAKI